MYFSVPGSPVYLTQAVSETASAGSSAQLPLPDVPVTVMINRPDPGLLHSLSAQWRAQGRRLFVVASAANSIKRVLPHADLHQVGRRTNPHFLEQTLTRIPSHYAPGPLQVTIVHELAAAPVPLPSTAPNSKG